MVNDMFIYFIVLCLLKHNDAPTLMYLMWGVGLTWEFVKSIMGWGC